MTILSDYAIEAALLHGRIEISPCKSEDIQPASVDLHLANDFKIFSPGLGQFERRIEDYVIDPQEEVPRWMYQTCKLVDGGKLALRPKDFLIASTVEEVRLGDDIGARIEGKSSLARLGIAIHSTGGFIDPGFRGQITLEISSVMPHPVFLRPGMKIAQIGFYELDRPARRPYGSEGLGSKYQDQRGATMSQYHENEPVDKVP